VTQKNVFLSPGVGETLRKARAGAFDHSSEEEKARAIDECIRSCSARAAVLALQPFPFVDGVLLPPLHQRLVRTIARIRGLPDRRAAHALFQIVRGRLVTPHLTLVGAKLVPLVPVVPDIIAVAVAYSATYALGEVSDSCFRGRRFPPAAEVRKNFDTLYTRRFDITYREKRDELLRRLRIQAPARPNGSAAPPGNGQR
jgi:uncharacterized protein (DUF697 family)